MSSKSPFGSASHFANMGSWKAGSPTSNPLLLKAQSRQVFVNLQQSHSTTESTITVLQQILETTTAWPNALLLCMRQVLFSEATTKGWAWCNHHAELVEPTVAVRNLLLVGSGCLEIPKGMAGIDSLDKHVEQISFRNWVSFRELRQLKGWQPRFQTTEAKSLVCSSHIWELISALQQILETTTAWPNALLLCMRQVLFFEAVTKGWAWCNHNAELVERTVAVRNLLLVLGNPKRNGGNRCLKQVSRTNLLSAVPHIFRPCAAEGPAAPLPTHGG